MTTQKTEEGRRDRHTDQSAERQGGRERGERERASEGKRERTLEGMYSCVTGLYRRPSNKRSHICAQSFHVGRHFLIVSYRNKKRKDIRE
jgi:hypothetical protein